MYIHVATCRSSFPVPVPVPVPVRIRLLRLTMTSTMSSRDRFAGIEFSRLPAPRRANPRVLLRRTSQQVAP